jgi:dihydropteroate synthase
LNSYFDVKKTHYMKRLEPRKFTIRQGYTLREINHPLIMGIINVTPDSFYAESRYPDRYSVLKQVEVMIEGGADIIDLGAMSSRPGAEVISSGVEMKRLEGIIPEIRSRWPNIIISVDTLNSETAAHSLSEGADWINDISGGMYDSEMIPLIAETKTPYICMHMRGTPKTMKDLSKYDDVVTTVYTYFAKQIRHLRDRGVHDIIIDPGFGFAKNIDQNFQLLQCLDTLQSLACPVMVGVSRKSMIYKTLGIKPEAALNGSTVLHTLALLQGAQILRVHDVKEACQVRTLIQRLGYYSFEPE